MSLAKDLHDETYSEHSDDLDTPVDPEWKAPWGVAAVILSVELCERLCYYTLKGTMKTFLQQKGGMDLAQASAMSASAATLCYLFCVPGGWLADTIGRYKVIVAMAALYCVGCALCVYASSDSIGAGSIIQMYLLGQLVFIAIGTGGIKPNISSFGADQFEGGGQKGQTAQESFFSFFYLAVNIGAFLAFTFLVNMATTQGYFIPYAIAGGCMFFALIMFLGATPCYKQAKVSAIGGTENMARIAKHFVYAAARGTGSQKLRAFLAIVGWLCIPVFLGNSLVGAMSTNAGVQDTCNQLSLVIGIICVLCLCIAHVDNTWIIEIDEDDYATWCDTCWFYGCCCFLFTSKRDDSDSETEEDGEVPDDEKPLSVLEIRATVAVVPVLLVVNICFGLCYNAMDEAFPTQGCQMDVRYNPWGDYNLTVPELVDGAYPEEYLKEAFHGQFNAAFLSLFNSAAIIIGTPILEVVFYPLGARFSKTGQCRFGAKLCTGMVLGACASLFAAGLEMYRRNVPMTDMPSNCGVEVSTGDGTSIPSMVSAVPAYYMAIPYALCGIAEVMVNPVLIGYAYMAAPPRVRSTVSAFNLLACGSLSHAFTATLQATLFPHDPNEGHLEYYYYVNAIAGLAGVGLYFMVSHFPCGRDVRPKRMRDDMEVAGDHLEEIDLATESIIGSYVKGKASHKDGTVFSDAGISRRA